MKHLILLTSMMILFLMGCGKSHDQAMKQVDTIKLNDGAKWVVDQKMMEIIKTMESEIMGSNAKDLSTYNELATSLEENIQLLISNCTMKGAPHDELHKWLHPYISSVKKLSKSEDIPTSQLYLDSIKSLFQKFNNYFE